MTRKAYDGEKLTVTFDGSLCIHARECVTCLPKVFVANAPGDWIQPDEGSIEEIVALAHNCPSGAIGYERKDGQSDERPPEVNRVRVRENGPLAFHADLKLGGESAATRATLCRCGQSKNKPYCDGAHVDAGFTATGEPVSKDLASLEIRGGPLEINPATDGPLVVNGPLEIMAGTGRAIDRTTKTALCRCGASDNKPYCDGSHRKVGFTSE